MYQKIKAKNLTTVLEAVKSTGMEEFVMDLKDDKWVVFAKDGANVVMTSVLVPRTAMAEYKRNNYDMVGVDVNKIEGFIQSKDDWIELEMRERTLTISDGEVSADLATIDPEAVAGHMSKSVDMDYEAIITGGFDKVIKFVKRAEGVLDTGSYYIGGREDGLYLYTSGDNGKMSQRIPWGDFEDYKIDWSVNNEPRGGDGAHTPKEDKAFDCIMGVDFTKSLNTLDGEAKMAVGNHIPLRLLYHTVGDDGNDTGIKVNYYQTPRINESGVAKIPDKIIEENKD